MAFEILLVEDNPLDVELVSEALAGWQTPSHVSVVDNGDDALYFLRKQGKYAEAPAPSLILLDLNLPKRSGVEVLSEIKQDTSFAAIPVIVLTTSDRETDVKNAYSLHANCYMTKPLEIDEFIGKVKAIENFWLQYVRLPAVRA